MTNFVEWDFNFQKRFVEFENWVQNFKNVVSVVYFFALFCAKESPKPQNPVKGPGNSEFPRPPSCLSLHRPAASSLSPEQSARPVSAEELVQIEAELESLGVDLDGERNWRYGRMGKYKPEITVDEYLEDR